MIENTTTRGIGVIALTLLLGCFAGAANAVPSFARQTGQECPACHGIKVTAYIVRLNGDDLDSEDGCGTPAGFT